MDRSHNFPFAVLDRSPERLLLAVIITHFGDSIDISLGALLEAQELGGYVVTEERETGTGVDAGSDCVAGRSRLRVRIVNRPAHIELTESAE